MFSFITVDKNTFKTLGKDVIFFWKSLENHFHISVRALSSKISVTCHWHSMLRLCIEVEQVS